MKIVKTTMLKYHNVLTIPEMRRREEGRKRGPYRKTLEAIILYLLKHPYATTTEIIRETGRENHAIVNGLHHLEKRKIVSFKPGKQNKKHWFITNMIAASSLIRQDTEFQTFLKTLEKAARAAKAISKGSNGHRQIARINMRTVRFLKNVEKLNRRVRRSVEAFGEFYEKNSAEIKQLDGYYRHFGVRIGEFEVNAFIKLVQAYREVKREVDRLMLLNPKDPHPLLMLFEAVKQPGRLPEIKTALRRAVASETVEIVAEPAKCPNCLVNLVQNRFCPKCGLDVLHYEFDLLNRPQPLKPAWRREG